MSVVGTTFSNGSAQQIILGHIIGKLTRQPTSQTNPTKELASETSDRSPSRAFSSTLTDAKLFDYEPGSVLDPFSPTFDARRWTKSLAKLGNEETPSRIAGISYRNMSVHGYGSDAGED